MDKYNNVWTADLPKEDRDNFQEYLRINKKLLDKLIKICYNMIRESETSTIHDYDSPSWAYKQADSNGTIRALKKIIALATPSSTTTD